MSKAVLKEVLTDRRLKALQPAPAGKRVVIWDSVVPGFGVRVTDKGSANFFVMRRLKGTRKFLRRTIGAAWRVPWKGPIKEDLPTPLAKAREEARKAVFELTCGIDPRERREAAMRAEQRKAKAAVDLVVEAFIAAHVVHLRSASIVTSTLRKKVIPAWRGRSIDEIMKGDVIRLVQKDGEAGRATAARHLLAHIKRMFGWAIAQDCYGLEKSPCEGASRRPIWSGVPNLASAS